MQAGEEGASVAEMGLGQSEEVVREVGVAQGVLGMVVQEQLQHDGG